MGQQLNLNKVVERTSEVTGIGKKLLSKIRTEEDVKIWKWDTSGALEYDSTTQVPKKL
eukprot:IDg8496t1